MLRRTIVARVLPRAIGVVCLISCIASARQTISREPVDTTVTKLARKSATFNGKLVRVAASFDSDGIEHSFLLEPNCGLAGTTMQPPTVKPECDLAISPWIPDEVENNSDIQALDRALNEGSRGTIYKHVSAVFTGKFICKPSCASAKGRILEIQKVDKLEVLPKDFKPHHPTGEKSGTCLTKSGGRVEHP
jgi:hypothetical protein